MKTKLPTVGQRVGTSLGEASVIGVNQLKETVTVQLESQATVELPVNEVSTKKRQGKEKRGKKPPKTTPPG